MDDGSTIAVITAIFTGLISLTTAIGGIWITILTRKTGTVVTKMIAVEDKVVAVTESVNGHATAQAAALAVAEQRISELARLLGIATGAATGQATALSDAKGEIAVLQGIARATATPAVTPVIPVDMTVENMHVEDMKVVEKKSDLPSAQEDNRAD